MLKPLNPETRMRVAIQTPLHDAALVNVAADHVNADVWRAGLVPNTFV